MSRWTLSWRRIGPILLTDARGRHCSFQCISSICWTYFSGVMVSPGSDRPQTTKQWPWPFFHASLALGSTLELLLSSATELVIASCHIKSTFRHMSQSEKWLVLLCTIREDNTSKMTVFFVFWSAHEAPTYQAFSSFQHASNAEWPWMVDVEF